MEQNIFWKSETAIERMLLVAIAALILSPDFWLLFLVFYALFEGALLLGRFITGKGLLIGAQIVVTGILLMFFHELPVMEAEYYVQPEESYISSVGIIAAAALIIYLILHLLSGVPVLFGVAVIAADAFIVTRFMYGYADRKPVFAIAIILTLNELCRFIAYITSGKTDKNRGWLAFFILLEVLVFMIPVSDKPIDWSFVYRIGYRIRDGFETLAENTGYYFSGIGDGMLYQSGYSGLGAAPGSLSLNNREEISVSTKGTYDSLYLTGKIMSDNPEDIADDLSGRRFAEFLYALYSHDIGREEARCFSRVEKLSVEMGYLRTRDIIRPENCLRIDYGKKDERDDSGTEFKRMHKKGDHYDSVYLNIDYGSKYLENIMKTPKEVPWPTFSEMEEYCSRLYDFQLSRSIDERDYNKWAGEKINLEGYLETGAMETPRMRELSEEITKGKENDYEAARAIESYLRQYKYSTRLQNSDDEGSKKQDSNNYVDEFLFETGKGYCVHFANSMVMLLRLSGIPARCVEGYCYAFPDTSTGRFPITGDRAHVWAEAYIEGIGWIPFEPTAVRRTSIDTGWNVTLPETEEEPLVEEESPDAEAEIFIPEIPDTAAINADLEDSAEDSVTERHFIDVIMIMQTLGTILIGLFIYGIVMLLVIILIRTLRYRAAPLSGKLEKNMKDILWLMNREFMRDGKEARLLEDYLEVIPVGESVSGERLEITELKALSGHIFSVYYRQRFAGKNATGVEVRDAEYLKKYLFARYLKGIFHR